MKEDLEEATKNGEKNGKQDSAQLINFLWEAGRGDDAKRAANDETYLDQLMREFKATHVSVADDDTAEESSNENE